MEVYISVETFDKKLQNNPTNYLIAYLPFKLNLILAVIMGDFSPLPTDSSDSVNDFVDTLVFCGNDFPNDDLRTLFAALQQRARDAKFRILATFLSECTNVAKEEIAKLPDDIRKDLPPVQTISDLASYYASHRVGPLAAGLEGILLVVVQVGMLIAWVATLPQYAEVPNKMTDTTRLRVSRTAFISRERTWQA